MSSQTVRRPENQRSRRSGKTKPRRYSRQTAHVEARHDGQPLIFGWGSHLSHSEKTLIQRRAIWGSTILIAIAIIAVVVGYWINFNIITPSLPITSVNGQPITQADYRKLVALKAQLEANKIYGVHGLIAQRDNLQKQIATQQTIIDTENKQINDLTKQLQALPASAKSQRTNLESQLADARAKLKAAQTLHDNLNNQYQEMLTNTIPQEEQLYVQSQIGNDSVDWLQDDVFINNWLATQSSSVQAKVEPSAAAVEKAIADFKANLPTSTSYNKFLSDDGIGDADVHAMMTLVLRRQNMQNYLASQITSPQYQVEVRAITVDTPQTANDILKQLKQGGNFAALAKKYSVDTQTNTKGGYLGWLARGQYAQQEADNNSGLIDNWIFDPARTVNEISPVLKENGSYHIIQILGIDPSRPVDNATLQSLKSNALIAWLLEQKAMPGVKITPVDQNMLLDSANMPPGLPSSPPSQQVPGGVPGGGLQP
jgi:parvulin-like peptidyl-prolyl isomerase